VEVKNAYLNADLTKAIYMRQPPGFTLTGSEGQVCCLFKALYGLTQTGQVLLVSLSVQSILELRLQLMCHQALHILQIGGQ